MIPGKGKIKIESGSDGLIVGSFDENNQILDTHSFGQGYITESAFTYDAFTGGPIMVTVQNEDGSFSQDGYLKNCLKCMVPVAFKTQILKLFASWRGVLREANAAARC